ncbi:hypothetical protein [Frigoriglobus tundricola]|uniref:DUF4350 domain-containing protein n=1 Tax=Frigoriglobus tundricola TaxID=2774151 RepID=A0A6M5YHD6_9BACT|nr:hypothetical protein [Frigoriglobus tundricola]QJW93475.1 hypothetical protein FTUN_0981 [Frigoriglobus tundricola]
MKRLTRGLAAVALLAAVLGPGAAPTARAQLRGFPEPPQPPPVPVPGGGTELFRALLAREGIQPVRAGELNNARTLNTDLIVIVIGSPGVDFQPLPQPLAWVRFALQVDGAALVASDSRVALHATSTNAPAWDNVTAQFSGGAVTADNQNDVHHNQAECPYVVPVSPDELKNRPLDPGRVWGVFRGLTRLATNQPTFIEEPLKYRAEFQYPLARLPRSTTPKGQRLRAPLFAVGGDGEDQIGGAPGYAFLALADSSVFINQMLLEEGTDNLKFALRTIEYLQGPGQSRKRCLFFENGRVIEKFDTLNAAVAKPRPKLPPEAMPNLGPLFGKNQEAIVKGVDKFADQLQTHDWLHQTKVGPSGSDQERASVARWIEAAVVLGAVAITLLLLRRSLLARHPLDVPPAPVTGAGAAATGPPGVFDRRQRELVRRNNLYEPVRNLMREFFAAAGAPPHPGPRLPPLEISDAVRKPGSLSQALRDMWRIAYGPPSHISAQRWFELEPYFDRLRQAHADGKWRFLTDET